MIDGLYIAKNEKRGIALCQKGPKSFSWKGGFGDRPLSNDIVSVLGELRGTSQPDCQPALSYISINELELKLQLPRGLL